MKFFITLFLTFYLAGFAFFQNYIKTLNSYDYPMNIDGAVLFTGGNGRLEMGVDYLNSIPNKPLLITGVNPAITKNILLKENILPIDNIARVELDYEAIDTIDNVKMVKKWSVKNNFNNVGLITSAYHVPRSLLLFQRTTPLLENLKIIPIPVKNTKTSQLYLFKEYNKYLYTYVSVFK